MARKKIVKKRGSKTCGYGGKKKHRGHGSRGGAGFGGVWDQKKTAMVTIWKGRLDKKGFTLHSARKKVKAINVGELEKMSAGKADIDITKLGYDKVLGMGDIKAKLNVTAKAFSAKATEKIEAAGGKAQTA